MKEGRKEGKMERRKDEKKERRKEGKMERWKDGIDRIVGGAKKRGQPRGSFDKKRERGGDDTRTAGETMGPTGPHQLEL